jgi:hypothetical protein
MLHRHTLEKDGTLLDKLAFLTLVKEVRRKYYYFPLSVRPRYKLKTTHADPSGTRLRKQLKQEKKEDT